MGVRICKTEGCTRAVAPRNRLGLCPECSDKHRRDAVKAYHRAHKAELNEYARKYHRMIHGADHRVRGIDSPGPRAREPFTQPTNFNLQNTPPEKFVRLVSRRLQ